MSRTDPAFLFYPGDASEDTQMMNRLERGAYFDILKAQKRFEKFTFDQLKKVLGKDFETVWPALQICLTCEEDMYFIRWVSDSIQRWREYSESRRSNRKSKEKHFLNDKLETNNQDMNKICSSHVDHMGNENGNGIENINSEKTGVIGEEKTIMFHAPQIYKGTSVLFVPELKQIFLKHRKTYQFDMQKDAMPLRKIGEAIAKAEGVSAYEIAGIDRVKQTFEALVVWSLTNSIYKHFQLSQFEKYIQAIFETFQSSLTEQPKKNLNKPSIIESNIETANRATEILKHKYGMGQQ